MARAVPGELRRPLRNDDKICKTKVKSPEATCTVSTANTKYAEDTDSGAAEEVTQLHHESLLTPLPTFKWVLAQPIISVLSS